MFFNHPHTLLNNQILVVASYAAIADCLTNLKNNKDIPKESKPNCVALVGDLKNKLRTLYASEFIRYTNSLARNLNMQGEMQQHVEKYMRLCSSLMEPTPAQRDKIQKCFCYYYERQFIDKHENIKYILGCFIDCCATQCLQKIFASVPEIMQRDMLINTFPNAAASMFNDADDSMIDFMLDAGMKADSEITWTSFLRDSIWITLLTSLMGSLRMRIQFAGNKESADNGKNCFSDQEIKAYTHILGALLTRKADPDIDEDYPGDDATPRGAARDVLMSLTENQYLSSEQKEKMASVLRMMIDAPRVHEFKPRMHYFDGGDGITAFRY